MKKTEERNYRNQKKVRLKISRGKSKLKTKSGHLIKLGHLDEFF